MRCIAISCERTKRCRPARWVVLLMVVMVTSAIFLFRPGNADAQDSWGNFMEGYDPFDDLDKFVFVLSPISLIGGIVMLAWNSTDVAQRVRPSPPRLFFGYSFGAANLLASGILLLAKDYSDSDLAVGVAVSTLLLGTADIVITSIGLSLPTSDRFAMGPMMIPDSHGDLAFGAEIGFRF